MYEIYVKKIIDIISNSNYDERIMFGEKGHNIGLEIYKKDGYTGLCNLIAILSHKFTISQCQEQYFNALRELEYSFNGICDEWSI